MRSAFILIAAILVASPAFADSQGSATGGTRGTQSTLSGCTYNSAAPALSSGQQVGIQCDASGRLLTTALPATPITASATGTTAATTATLAASTTKKTYLCGFSIRANATSAATGNATVTGTVTGTMNFTQWTAPLASGVGTVEETFYPCVPSSAVNTGIAVVSAAPGTGGVVSVSAWGYQQ